jgi:signal transduction histidine kinase
MRSYQQNLLPIELGAGLLPVDTVVNNRRLIMTRFVAAFMLAGGTWFAFYSLELALPTTELYSLAALIFAYNIAVWILTRRWEIVSARTGRTCPRVCPVVVGQIVMDALCLTVFIHWTGGITSPALVFFFLHAIMVVLMLPGWVAFVYDTAVMFAIGGVAFLEIIQVLPHYSILPGVPFELYYDGGFIASRIAFFAVALFATSLVTAAVMVPLRQRERLLSAIFHITSVVSSTLDKEQVLQRLVHQTAEATHITGIALRLVEPNGRELRLHNTYGTGYRDDELVHVDETEAYQRAMKGEIVFVERYDFYRYMPFVNPRSGIISVVVVPIMSKRPLGIIVLYATRYLSDSPYLRHFLRAIADEGAIAIENALTHQALQNAEKQRGQFVRVFTHELRSPVVGAQSLLRVALMNPNVNAERLRDILERLNRRMDNLLSLINDLLALAASKARDLQQPHKPININKHVKDVTQDYLYQAEEKNIRLSIDICNQPAGVLATDEGLHLIVNNLVGNAIKYTPNGGNVRVKLSCDEAEKVRLTVRDTGIGIPKEALESLGQEFYRAPNAKESGIMGTGLGLATVYQHVSHFNGEIEVESEPNHGTTFRVTFPTCVALPEDQGEAQGSTEAVPA